MPEIWILGATGRVGRAVAPLLVGPRAAASGLDVVLVGRNPERLAGAASVIGGAARVLQAGSLTATAELIAREQPSVVINTIGPFAETAMPIIDACLPGSHYLDITNEILAMNAVFARHDDAVTAGRSLVTATGFGVLGVEAAVLKACAGLEDIDTVRGDAMPLVAPEPGRMGEALAGSIIGGLTAGGLRYAGGRLVRAGIGSRVETITTPDGTTIRTGSAPTGELIAAQRASGAPNVLAATSLLPTGLPVRVALTAIGVLARIGWIRSTLVRRMAAMEGSLDSEAERTSTWARARVRTTAGRERTAWLRAGDAMDFTAAVTAEVASRLARGEGRPGAFTPGGLFGAELAEAAGAELSVD
ncbi:membrane protein [Microlunatus endophyticus]|uniref:Membrane protein n=1 Tax=Microlunatus endophyticus TaxID=1716077 RepID=A0A917W1X6_9ACTN|nr:saccharopine dehydrogenase NADP-binding domain-containing protein [Microlunatus endophyticus]GGL58260.1 membrane protein [Microlunatus endophyticus]